MKSKLIIRHSLFIILLALVACKEVPPPDLDLIVEDWNGGPVFYSVTVNYSGKNSKVTQKGVCWSDSNDQPTISDNTLYAGDGAEDFAGEIEGLQNNTTYYVRAFSQTKTGTDYSPVVDLMNGRAWMDMGKPTSGDVYQCLSVLSEDEIHLAGDDGVQLKSTDGGNNWEVNDHSVNWDIYNMQFINSNVGFQTTENGRVRKTMDGGITWADYSTDFSEVLEGLFFMDTDIGYVVARSGNVYKSVDGGETWSPNSVSLLGSDQLRDIYFLSGTTGYLISRDGYVYKTSDSGLSWAQLNSSSIGAGGQTLVFLNENNGIAVMNKSIFRTDDGGENWTQVFESTHELKAISFLDENIGVVCGSYSQVLRTSDGGITWVADIVDQTNGIVSFEAIQLLSPDLGYASGHAGKILKFH